MKTATSSIQLNITVFTAALLSNYPAPSLDPAAPTAAPADCILAVQTGGSGSAIKALAANNHLHLALHPETHVVINVYSENGNYDNPVIFYELYEPTGKNPLQIYTTLQLYPNTKTRVPDSFNPLETAFITKNFWTGLAHIHSRGTGEYGIRTLVFDDDLNPYGYFEFPITITAE